MAVRTRLFGQAQSELVEAEPVQGAVAVPLRRQKTGLGQSVPPAGNAGPSYVPEKAWYFFSAASSVVLLPYLNLFFKQLGFSSEQIGLITFVRPWLCTPASFLLLGVADSMKIQRGMLLCSLLLSTATRGTLAFTHDFVPVMSVFLLAELCASPLGGLSEAAVVSNCKQEGDYGRLRAWASIGWGVCSILAGALLAERPLSMAFVFHVLLAIPCVAAILFFRMERTSVLVNDLPRPDDSGQALQGPALWSSLSSMAKSPAVMAFMFRTLLMGFGHGIITTYLFLHLESLGADRSFMGIALAVNCATEIPAFQFQSWILKRFSVESVLDFAILSYILRLLCYGLLPLWGSVWLLMPVELLHGTTFGIGYGTGTVYAKKISPPGLESTMQGIFQGIYFGVGVAIGGLFGGYVMQEHGSGAVFKWGALVTIAGWLALRAMTAIQHPTLDTSQKEE